VKAVNQELKEAYVKQAVDYAANQGVEWVVLTNAQEWQIYRVTFGQPISHELLVSLKFMAMSPKSGTDLEALFLLTREAQGKSLLDEFLQQRQALSRFSVGAVVLTEPVLAVIRRELKRISPDVRIESEDLLRVLTEEVIKRDVLDGDRADEARRKLAKVAARLARAKIEKDQAEKAPGTTTPAGAGPEINATTVPAAPQI
jgi:hypothetical protein